MIFNLCNDMVCSEASRYVQKYFDVKTRAFHRFFAKPTKYDVKSKAMFSAQ